jgi:hypothetical protein
MPKVITSYNGESLIGETLDGVLAQTYLDYEMTMRLKWFHGIPAGAFDCGTAIEQGGRPQCWAFARLPPIPIEPGSTNPNQPANGSGICA